MSSGESSGFRLKPTHLSSSFLTVILLVAELAYGAVGGLDKIVITLGACVAFEAALSLFLLGRRPRLLSAYVSGLSLTILLRPESRLVWPLLVGAFLSIASKYTIRYRDRHLFNPTNFGISILILFAPSHVALLSHEMGNHWIPISILWVLGFTVAGMARILHVSATYAACFLGLAWVRSLIVGSSFWTEFAPATGPMYQLLVFFMLTDPRTTVGSRRGRVGVVALVAFVEALLRIGNDLEWPGFHVFAPAPAILALFLVGPIALAIDLRRRSRTARSGDGVSAPSARRAPAPG